MMTLGIGAHRGAPAHVEVADEGRQRRRDVGDHDAVLTGGDARGPELFDLGAEHDGEPIGVEPGTTARIREVRQTIHDPAGHHDWVVELVADCDASDQAGELVMATRAFRRL